jgi:uncharacterized glyoxalase superfamily protein PhnB
MPIKALIPMLRTWDFPETLAFYTQVLGFVRVASDDAHAWAALRRDAVEIMISAPNPHLPDSAPMFTGSLYLHCDDVDAWWATLRDKTDVCYPLADFDYGMREFAVYDNNGYLLQFGQPVSE